MAVLGLHCCVDFSLVMVSSLFFNCSAQVTHLTVLKLLAVVASLVLKHKPRLQQSWHVGSVVAAPRLQSTVAVSCVAGP